MRRIDGRGLLLAALFTAAAGGFAFAQDDGASRLTGLKLSDDQPIEIQSDRLEVRESDNVAIFTGNVTVVQGPTSLRSGKMTVHYAQGGGSAATGSANIERLEVDGNVSVRSDTQAAVADRGTFDMASEVMVLTGSEVILSEGDNIVTGCKLTVQMRTGQARLDGCGGDAGGRVKMLLQPKSMQE